MNIGMDLAKQVFQVHGVDRHEQVVCRRQLKRAQMRDFFLQLPPCLVAMEACGSALLRQQNRCPQPLATRPAAAT
ncbi:transposase [Pseudomonas panipatensis]|uniref:Transposase n=1 Tax=Pseudomonas panipatensis TaxID=428992 RepID=A0A1G8FSD4_9PSED|nr:transposase [Pseudomonas panipatensis]SMP52411.1 hypothetical protein SAMN06295951_10331 [Pseudomonas panipatensis]